MKPSLGWLLVFAPAAIAIHYASPQANTTVFVLACLAIIPLAGFLGRATEHLASRTSESVGGLLNATFGNAAELIIGLMALHRGLYSITKASITGSIIGNVLLVLGASILAGGLRHQRQSFNLMSARAQSTLLMLAAIALLLPAMVHHVADPSKGVQEQGLSVAIAVVLLLAYAMHLLFSLSTHRELLEGESEPEASAEPVWSLRRALGVLVASTAATAWISEILIGSVEQAAHKAGMSELFVGVIVVATVGNAAEHSSAVMASWRNRMDLALSIAVGSSIQIALFVAPVLVLASYFLGPKPMDLVFTTAEVTAVAVSVIIMSQVAGDGESNWLEGAQLLAVYVILGFVFYFLP